ncbi:MAG: ADP-ribosylglycohydrolase family protein [Chthoniobacteraceae bacterium]
MVPLNHAARIHGCWMGKSVGGTLGLPAEGKMERLNFSFYDPVPTVAPPNDDLELQLVWLHLVEQAGASLTREDFANAWRRHIHYMWDEYGRCRWNLRRGVPVESLGIFENPFHAGMGSPIRSEIWACLFPGDPDSAAHYAALDASLDHGIEGIAGEVLFAAMQSEIAAGKSLEQAVGAALRYIPGNCETARAVHFVRERHRRGVSEWVSWEALLECHQNENFTHAPLNVALTLWALLYGGGDFEKSILLAVNAGYDTDCTAATVGATLGLALGKGGIPQHWIDPIGESVFVGPGIHGIAAPATLAELTSRVAALTGKLETKTWGGDIWTQRFPSVCLADLPGTISLFPADGSDPTAWANGEFPATVKAAGGAHWEWHGALGEPRKIICLARCGAKLYIDDKLVIECLAGLPYVPATHRSAPGSTVEVTVAPGRHTVRLELNHKGATQGACVILAYPNGHLCPWTETELPDKALLPSL